jgi:hypothetical protein
VRHFFGSTAFGLQWSLEGEEECHCHESGCDISNSQHVILSHDV